MQGLNPGAHCHSWSSEPLNPGVYGTLGFTNLYIGQPINMQLVSRCDRHASGPARDDLWTPKCRHASQILSQLQICEVACKGNKAANLRKAVVESLEGSLTGIGVPGFLFLSNLQTPC